MIVSAESSRGSLVAITARTSWRVSPSAVSLSPAQLDEVTPLLYDSGAAGLGWWRIRRGELRDTPCAELLHQAFRLQALQAGIHQTKIEKIFRLLRIAGVDAMLLKGWAIARRYPQAALRPYGDIDLIVRPQDRWTAQRVIESEEARGCWVDLHSAIDELPDTRAEDLFSRAQLVPCGEEQVRVPAEEDHFALLAIHFLKHGGWRPSWLCDIALLLESMSDDFDWDLCLSKSQPRANWILSAIGLAHSLLGAELEGGDIAARAGEIPSWLPRAVLKQWETPFAIKQPPMSHRAPMRSYLRNPRGLFSDLMRRWPNPILATVSVKGKFNRLPRFPYQLANCFLRAGQFVFPRIKRA